MALAISSLAAALSSTNGASIGTIAVPDGGVLYLCVGTAFVNGTGGAAMTIGGTLDLGGWTEIGAVQDFGSRRTLWVIRGINTSGVEQSGTVTLTSSDAPNTGYQEHIYDAVLFTGGDETTPNGAVATNSGSGTSGTVTVTGTPDAGDYVFAVFVHTNASADMTINAELSNELIETGGGANLRRMLTAYDSSPDANPVPGVSWTGSEDWAGIAFIVNVGAGGGAATSLPPPRAFPMPILNF